MSHFANLKQTLSETIRNLGLASPDTSTRVSLSGVPFDSLRIDDAGQSPQELPALFDSRERSLGNPARLFPGHKCEKGEKDKLEHVRIQWLNVLDGLQPYGLRGQIAGINTYLNRSGDAPTLARLGQNLTANTQWTAPLRVFHNAGSEHVAFAKYLSLRKIGVSADRLRLVWVEDSIDATSRVVLAATFAGHNYILDNRRTDIVEDGALKQFRPYCSASKSNFSVHWDGPDDNGWEGSLKQLGLHALH